MARDRQRAKQRKARRAQTGPDRPAPRQGADGSGLEHVSGEVDEFEAALVRGAGGLPVDADDAFAEDEDPEAAQQAFGDEEDDELVEEAVGAAPIERRGEAAVPGAPTKRGVGRFVGFLRASWAELQRVQWPDRRQVSQATAVVIGFVIVAGLYLGVADWVAKRIVDVII